MRPLRPRPAGAPRARSAAGQRRRRMALGAAFLAVLAAITYGAFVRALPGTHHWSVDAVFSDSGQIVPGSPVRIAGVDVGRVESVRRGPGTTALLTLRVDRKGRPLHRDAVATIRPRLFLEGSYYVDLRAGSPSAPRLGDGATIPLGQTAVPVSFTRVLSTFTRPVRGSLVTVVHELARGLGGGGAEAFGASLEELGPALHAGATATQATLGERPDDVARLVRGADRATSALVADAPALAAAITAVNRVTGALAGEQTALRATLDGLAATARRSPGPLRALTAGLPALRQVAADVRPALPAAPAQLRRTATLTRELRGLLAPAELPRAARLLVPATDGLADLTPRLRRLLPVVGRVATCVGDQGHTLLTTKLDDGVLSTGQPVWLELAHSAVSGTSLSQGFDAAGHAVRFATSVQPGLLALGSVPGVGMTLTNAQAPALKLRPQWEGPTPPPLHPEVPCAGQPLGGLQAPAVAAPATRTAPIAPAPGVTGADLLRAVRRAAAREARAARGDAAPTARDGR